MKKLTIILASLIVLGAVFFFSDDIYHYWKKKEFERKLASLVDDSETEHGKWVDEALEKHKKEKELERLKIKAEKEASAQLLAEERNRKEDSFEYGGRVQTGGCMVSHEGGPGGFFKCGGGVLFNKWKGLKEGDNVCLGVHSNGITGYSNHTITGFKEFKEGWGDDAKVIMLPYVEGSKGCTYGVVGQCKMDRYSSYRYTGYPQDMDAELKETIFEDVRKNYKEHIESRYKEKPFGYGISDYKGYRQFVVDFEKLEHAELLDKADYIKYEDRIALDIYFSFVTSQTIEYYEKVKRIPSAHYSYSVIIEEGTDSRASQANYISPFVDDRSDMVFEIGGPDTRISGGDVIGDIDGDGNLEFISHYSGFESWATHITEKTREGHVLRISEDCGH